MDLCVYMYPCALTHVLGKGSWNKMHMVGGKCSSLKHLSVYYIICAFFFPYKKHWHWSVGIEAGTEREKCFQPLQRWQESKDFSIFIVLKMRPYPWLYIAPWTLNLTVPVMLVWSWLFTEKIIKMVLSQTTLSHGIFLARLWRKHAFGNAPSLLQDTGIRLSKRTVLSTSLNLGDCEEMYKKRQFIWKPRLLFLLARKESQLTWEIFGSRISKKYSMRLYNLKMFF